MTTAIMWVYCLSKCCVASMFVCISSNSDRQTPQAQALYWEPLFLGRAHSLFTSRCKGLCIYLACSANVYQELPAKSVCMEMHSSVNQIKALLQCYAHQVQLGLGDM